MGDQGLAEASPDFDFSEIGDGEVTETPERDREDARTLNSIDDLFCQYPGCDVPLVYSGRGRKPKFCGQHKPSKARTSSTPASNRSLDARLKRVAAGLEENIALAGAFTSPFLPLTGAVILRDANRCANGIVAIAAKNPKALAALEQVNRIGPGVQVGKTLASVGVALMLDTGKMDGAQFIAGKNQVANFLGIYSIYLELTQNPGSPAEPVKVTPPPRASFV